MFALISPRLALQLGWFREALHFFTLIQDEQSKLIKTDFVPALMQVLYQGPEVIHVNTVHNTATLQKKSGNDDSNESQTKDLLITGLDASTLSYKRLVDVKAIKLTTWRFMSQKSFPCLARWSQLLLYSICSPFPRCSKIAIWSLITERFWDMVGNWKWAGFPFNLSSHNHICVAQYLFSIGDD